MLDLRIYRRAFLPLIPVLLVAMFSISSRPEPVITKLAPDAFSTGRSAANARALMRLFPNRAPGSEDDRAAAAFVAERFGAVESGRVQLQRFRSDYRGRSVPMQNVVLTLPGVSNRRLVLMAARDSRTSPGANSSAAGTGALLELASDLGGASHRDTLVLVSTDGGSADAAGAREFAERFPGRAKTEAAIVIEQPAVVDGQRPYLVPWSTGDQSTAIQLVQSAKSAIRTEVGTDPGIEGFFGHFMRLAVPFAFQQQGPLIENGIDAIALSSNGELPPRRPGDRRAALSPTKLGQFGRTALSLVLALDADPGQVDHGPTAYVTVGDNLIPGWALALIGLALLLPPLAVAVDGFARARRRRLSTGRWLRWVLAAAVPFAASAIAAYLLVLVGLIPDTGFPFNPRLYPVDGPAFVALGLIALAFGVSWYATRELRRPPSDEDLSAAAPAIGLVMAAAAVLVWILNPYAGLLLAPAVYLCLFASSPESRGTRAQRSLLVAAGLLGPLAAALYVAAHLGGGVGVAWRALLFVTSGQVSPAMTLCGCLLAGALVATLATIRRGGAEPPVEPDIRTRGPVTYAGPGAVGGGSSASGATPEHIVRSSPAGRMDGGTDVRGWRTTVDKSLVAPLTEEPSSGRPEGAAMVERNPVLKEIHERISSGAYRIDAAKVADAILLRLAASGYRVAGLNPAGGDQNPRGPGASR